MGESVKSLNMAELEGLVDKASKEVVEMMTSVMLEVVGKADPGWKGGTGASFHASIGLAGNYVGNLYLVAPQETAIKLRNGMLGDDSAELEGVADALGEIVNMLAGSVQTNLSGAERAITLSIPSVLDSADWPKHAGHEREGFGLRRFHSVAGPLEIGLQLLPAPERR